MDNGKILKRLEIVVYTTDQKVDQLRKEIDTRETRIQTLLDTKEPIYKLMEEIGKDGK